MFCNFQGNRGGYQANSSGGRRRLYRSRHGQFLGLCQGIADWRDIPVHFIRIGFIMLAIFTGFIPALIVYVVFALILNTDPGEEAPQESKQDFEKRYKKSKDDVVDGIRWEYREAKRRVSRMENDIIDREKDWDARFQQEG